MRCPSELQLDAAVEAAWSSMRQTLMSPALRVAPPYVVRDESIAAWTAAMKSSSEPSVLLLATVTGNSFPLTRRVNAMASVVTPVKSPGVGVELMPSSCRVELCQVRLASTRWP